MTLLLDELEIVDSTGDPSGIEVTGIEHDSRRVRPGALFCALPGRSADGRRFAREALERGAVGIVVEGRRAEVELAGAVEVVVPEGAGRHAMAQLSAAFFGFPARELTMVGVTGTNGKTTVTHLLAAVLREAGEATTVIGTLSGARTTPESNELQAMLAEARAAGGGRGAVAMEVSSHALAQARVDAIHFDVVVFTNLSHDHLDFHGSMEEYFDVKASLFTPARAVRGIVNADSPWGRRLLERPQIPLVAVEAAQASEVELRIGSSAFTWRTERVRVPLSGAINVGNALLAAEAAYALGIDAGTIAAGLARSEPVPGRMEVVATGGGEGPPFAVLVDYAHTPDGLAAVLREARHLAAPGARVVVVLGCGGDRDKAKRPEMGALAAQLADLGILTSDNARSEDPAMILDEMVAGVPPEAISSGRVVIDEDRERAIGTALDLAAPGDVVLVAGKGHETTQVHGQRAVPFDDREVAREHLRRRFAGDPAAWVRGRGA